MAEGAPITHRPLSFDEVQRLGASSTHSKVLPTLCLVSHAGDPPEEVRILGYLVRCRTNGFMVILPGLTTVQSVLDALVGELGSEQLVYKLEEANLEDSRGRRFGKGSVYLVDFSAECALFFSRAPALRGAAAVSIQRLKVGDSVARPAAKAAWQMSEAWIAELGGEDEAIQEYFTADSDLPGAASEEHSPSHTYGPGTPDEAVGRLEAQVRDLQDQLARSMQSQQPVPPRAKAEPHRGVAPPATLFDVPKSSLDASTLLHLKQLAGPAPGKLTRLEEEHKQVPEDARATEAQDQFAELQAGVLEDDELAAVIAQSRDPLHQILALQLKQTAALTQRLSSQVPRDQITAALGNEPGSSSSNGVRGCVARDAYLRTMEDIVTTGKAIANNAAADMGLSSNQVGSGLLRQYMERRIALGDQRMLTYIGQFMACSWQVGFEQGNDLAMGLAARGMMMVEQMSLDSGSCQFAWLLSAFPEPDLQQISQNKKRLSIKPYARLASAPWIAGNLAFLKDLDYLESRLRGNKGNDKADDRESKDDASTKKPGGKGKKKGKEKKEGDSEAAS